MRCSNALHLPADLLALLVRQLGHAPLCTRRLRSACVRRFHCGTRLRVKSGTDEFARGTFPTAIAMKKVLQTHNVAHNTGHTCFSINCIFCMSKKPGKNKSVDFSMYVNMFSGDYLCLACGAGGSWTQLEDQLGLPRSRRSCQTSGPQAVTPTVANVWEAAVPVASASSELVQRTLVALDLPLESGTTLARLSLRVCADGALLCPMLSAAERLVGVRQLTADGRERQLCTPAPSLLSGWGTLTARADHVTLVTRLVDAIALHHACRAPVLLLPHGSKYLCPRLLPWLERFNSIRLWLPGDSVSWSSVCVFAKKLSEKRCTAVRAGGLLSGPAESVRAGVSAATLVEAGSPVRHEAVTTFSSLRDNVKSELTNAKQVAGVQWVRMAALNKYLCGHRRGELTVFSGTTGSGKTTFMSDFSLDLCMQGVNTLWGSFEINNTRLAKVMLTQFSGVSLEKNITLFDQMANDFQKLPLWFMTFHGQNKINTVLDAMSHATYMHDIGHVVLDNLQFMMGAGGVERFLEQDNVVSKFRQFATAKNCHVSLVIHPRKEKDEDELGVCSVFGGARATQEADNVIILQVLRTGDTNRKYLQILKNRFSGDLGSVPLRFNRESLSFTVGRPAKPREVAATAAAGKSSGSSVCSTPPTSAGGGGRGGAAGGGGGGVGGGGGGGSGVTAGYDDQPVRVRLSARARAIATRLQAMGDCCHDQIEPDSEAIAGQSREAAAAAVVVNGGSDPDVVGDGGSEQQSVRYGVGGGV